MKIKAKIELEYLSELFRKFEVYKGVDIYRDPMSGKITVSPHRFDEEEYCGRLVLFSNIFIDEKFTLSWNHNYPQGTAGIRRLCGEVIFNAPSLERFMDATIYRKVIVHVIEVVEEMDNE
jgi:hypothetical protein